jgi:hypothetical protein
VPAGAAAMARAALLTVAMGGSRRMSRCWTRHNSGRMVGPVLVWVTLAWVSVGWLLAVWLLVGWLLVGCHRSVSPTSIHPRSPI